MFALKFARSTVYFEQGAGENKIWEWSEVFWILEQKLKQNKWQKNSPTQFILWCIKVKFFYN